MHVQAQISPFLREESPTSRLVSCDIYHFYLHTEAFSQGLLKPCGHLQKLRLGEIILKRQKDGHCCGMVLCSEVRLAVVDRVDCSWC